MTKSKGDGRDSYGYKNLDHIAYMLMPKIEENYAIQDGFKINNPRSSNMLYHQSVKVIEYFILLNVNEVLITYVYIPSSIDMQMKTLLWFRDGF